MVWRLPVAPSYYCQPVIIWLILQIVLSFVFNRIASILALGNLALLNWGKHTASNQGRLYGRFYPRQRQRRRDNVKISIISQLNFSAGQEPPLPTSTRDWGSPDLVLSLLSTNSHLGWCLDWGGTRLVWPTCDHSDVISPLGSDGYFLSSVIASPHPGSFVHPWSPDKDEIYEEPEHWVLPGSSLGPTWT